MKTYDLIIIGSGPAGLMAGIQAATKGLQVAIFEKLDRIAAKLKASGGGKCNLTNTLADNVLMSHFGRQGRFLEPALHKLNHKGIVDFFASINIQTHAPDGLRVFPVSHQSKSIVDGLHNRFIELGGTIHLKHDVQGVHTTHNRISGITVNNTKLPAQKVIIATGGLSYPHLGATGDGFTLAKKLGHHTTPLYPAMIPLHTRETWVAHCRADTVAKATILINIKGKKQRATGDLIFTKTGIRGPVVLDFSREITPLLATHKEVPVLVNMTGGRNEEEIRSAVKKSFIKNPQAPLLSHITPFLATSIAKELCKCAQCDPQLSLSKIPGTHKALLYKLLAWTPLTICGHDGFEKAMVTRGGIALKEVNPTTMQSKLIDGLYFCGEVLDLDGPCGGYNLTCCFSSGFLAGISAAESNKD